MKKFLSGFLTATLGFPLTLFALAASGRVTSEVAPSTSNSPR